MYFSENKKQHKHIRAGGFDILFLVSEVVTVLLGLSHPPFSLTEMSELVVNYTKELMFNMKGGNA